MRQNKDIFIIIILIFSYPIGLFFLWKKSNFKYHTKIILTIVFSCFIPMFILFSSYKNIPSEIEVKNCTEGSFKNSSTEPFYDNKKESEGKKENSQAPYEENLKKPKEEVKQSTIRKNKEKAEECTLDKKKKEFKENIPEESDKICDEDKKQEEPSDEDSKPQVVYISPHGKKYHFKNRCGSGSYSPISLEKAKEKGYLPCKKCAK